MTDTNLPARLGEIFRQLHRHPELALEEFESTRLVKQVLTEHGIELVETGLPTGAVCRIGHGNGPVIGLRGDMDALPIQEETDLPYRSCVPGKMHACGHDFHTTVVLGAALLLKEREAELPGQALVVFQPAEENTKGAKLVVGSGAVDAAQAFVGIHSYPSFPVGTLGLKTGPVMAAVDWFRVVIRGQGAHAAQPHKSVDPVPVMAVLITALQTVVSRAIDPFSPAVLSITHAEAGRANNVIPETAVIEGTVRTLRPADREKIRECFHRITESVCAAWGAGCEIDWDSAIAAVINDGRLCDVGREMAAEMGFAVKEQEDTMGGEDFSEFLQNRPGLFVRIGTGLSYVNHHPRFAVDPDAIWPASRYCAALTERLMRETF